jgi:hypothetical protein
MNICFMQRFKLQCRRHIFSLPPGDPVLTRTASLGLLLHTDFPIGSYLTFEQAQQKMLYERVQIMHRSVPLHYNFLTLRVFNHRDPYVHNEALPDNTY